MSDFKFWYKDFFFFYLFHCSLQTIDIITQEIDLHEWYLILSNTNKYIIIIIVVVVKFSVIMTDF